VPFPDCSFVTMPGIPSFFVVLSVRSLSS